MNQPTRSKSWLKILLLILLIAAALTAVGFLFGTETGQDIWKNPAKYHAAAREWVKAHVVIAPLCMIAVYTFLTILSLPVWWLPTLAGYGFGLVMGIFWAQTSFTLSALAAAALSRYLLSDWFHRRVESHVARLRTLDEKMEHNGLWVVLGVRLAHVLPHGLSNYVFGLTQISMIDITIGTFIGGLPGGIIGVGIGAGYDPWHDLRFRAVLVVIGMIMFSGIILRYLKPEWFKSMGIE